MCQGGDPRISGCPWAGSAPAALTEPLERELPSHSVGTAITRAREAATREARMLACHPHVRGLAHERPTTPERMQPNCSAGRRVRAQRRQHPRRLLRGAATVKLPEASVVVLPS